METLRFNKCVYFKSEYIWVLITFFCFIYGQLNNKVNGLQLKTIT